MFYHIGFVYMKLIVGLWNPWKEYSKTRHNAGFLVLDQFVQGEWSFRFDTKYTAELLEITRDWAKILCCKPQTFMNRSGISVWAIVNFYKIDPNDILVIHDEIDFPSAKIQLKLWGSPAGHNGLKDIIAKVWTDKFWRLRIGVDRPINKEQVADYVLTNFTKQEIDNIDKQWNEIEEKILEFLSA